jgi:hypothetical protein
MPLVYLKRFYCALLVALSSSPALLGLSLIIVGRFHLLATTLAIKDGFEKE